MDAAKDRIAELAAKLSEVLDEYWLQLGLPYARASTLDALSDRIANLEQELHAAQDDYDLLVAMEEHQCMR